MRFAEILQCLCVCICATKNQRCHAEPSFLKRKGRRKKTKNPPQKKQLLPLKNNHEKF